jgi:hypothetical protein
MQKRTSSFDIHHFFSRSKRDPSAFYEAFTKYGTWNFEKKQEKSFIKTKQRQKQITKYMLAVHRKLV